tara:strand:- start:6129 stop:7010 length:882 start_codon:yes stop_codon:yes gene_type:complete
MTNETKRNEFLNPTTIDELVRRVVEACGQTVPASTLPASSVPSPNGSGLPRTFTDKFGKEHSTRLTNAELYLALKEAARSDSNLKENDRFFADSLYRSWQEKGSVTDKQMPQVVRLVNKNAGATTPGEDRKPSSKPSSQPANSETENIMGMFEKASEKLKRPSVEFDCKDVEGVEYDGKVVLRKVTRGPNKGSVSITSDGGYGQNRFYGRIQEDGELDLNWRGEQNREWIEKLIEMLNADMHGMVKRYGAKTGRCCFCKKPLTDPQSVAAGFGKTCSRHYGLQSEYRAARQGG